MRCAIIFFIAVAHALMAAGCGSSSKEIPVYPVSGSVSVNGKPAIGAQVIFHPVDGKPNEPKPTGTVDKEGKFTLTTRAQGDGAPAGEYKVVVTLREQIGNPDEGMSRNVLPDAYATPEKTPLNASVATTANTLPPFEIRSR